MHVYVLKYTTNITICLKLSLMYYYIETIMHSVLRFHDAQCTVNKIKNVFIGQDIAHKV